jgi:hypothetical protein
MDLPLYYSYAIITAPDGRSAVVEARGDLDGDGRESRFAVRVSVSRAGKVDVGAIEITDEWE